MTKLKKSVVLILAIAIVLISMNTNILASQIQQRPANNNTSNNASSNTSNGTNNNSTNQPSNNTSNNSSNNSSNISGNNTNFIGGGSTNNAAKPINTSNSTENLPYTGFGDKYLSFALVILLALVLGMFSLVQYNKIIKKENQD